MQIKKIKRRKTATNCCIPDKQYNVSVGGKPEHSVEMLLEATAYRQTTEGQTFVGQTLHTNVKSMTNLTLAFG